MAAGFVLGEGIGLLGRVVTEMVAVMTLAGTLALLLCLLFGGWEKKISGGENFLPLFEKRGKPKKKKTICLWTCLFLGFAVLGFWRGKQARLECEREQELGLDERRLEVLGRVHSIRQNGSGWVLVMDDCIIYKPERGNGQEKGKREEKGRIRRIQAYIEETGEKSGGTGSRDPAAVLSRPKIGNKILVNGMISVYQAPRNPGEFDYQSYYRSLKLNYRIFGSSWEITDGKYSKYREWLFRMSVHAGRILDKIADQEDAGVFKAAILGEKSAMDEGIQDLYQKSGISHLLAISGLHLAFIGAVVYGILRRLGFGYGKAGLIGGCFLVSYGIMAGASPSVLRALVMALCGFLAAYLGRTPDLLSSLALAALLILWDSPYRLLQSGVQLSFGAVAGIGGLGPALADGFFEVRDGMAKTGESSVGGRPARAEGSAFGAARAGKSAAGKARAEGSASGAARAGENVAGKARAEGSASGAVRAGESVAGTARAERSASGAVRAGESVAGTARAERSASGAGKKMAGVRKKASQIGEKAGKAMVVSLGMQLLTLPVILYHFFQIPLYGMFLNFLAVPLMGIVIASGTAGIILGSISLPLGRFVVGSGHIILQFYQCLCRLWLLLPGSIQILGRPEASQIAACYGVLAAALWVSRRRRKVFSALLMGVSVFLLLPLPVSGMEVTFLDVGQGDGICIRTSKVSVLVDGGSTDQKNLGEKRLEPFLKSEAVPSVDYAIVSHGDQDHINGLVYLMEQKEIRIKNLVLPMAGQEDEIYGRLKNLAESQGGKVLWMGRGDRLDIKDLHIACIYPQKEISAADDRNEHSLVLQVSYGDFHILLTGDMSGQGEKELMAWEKEKFPQIHLLKVAHHGSRYSSTPQWLDAVHPVWAVISYGEGNRYGHPGQEVLDNLAAQDTIVYETGKSGAIMLETDGKRVWWNLKFCGFQKGGSVIE